MLLSRECNVSYFKSLHLISQKGFEYLSVSFVLANALFSLQN